MPMRGDLNRLVFAMIIGVVSVSAQAALAEQEASKEQESVTPMMKPVEPQDNPVKPLPSSEAPTDANKTVDTESSIAADKGKDDKKPKKNDSCRPGSLALLGVGC